VGTDLSSLYFAPYNSRRATPRPLPRRAESVPKKSFPLPLHTRHQKRQARACELSSRDAARWVWWRRRAQPGARWARLARRRPRRASCWPPALSLAGLVARCSSLVTPRAAGGPRRAAGGPRRSSRLELHAGLAARRSSCWAWWRRWWASSGGPRRSSRVTPRAAGGPGGAAGGPRRAAGGPRRSSRLELHAGLAAHLAPRRVTRAGRGQE
jgi:hypothetical protein